MENLTMQFRFLAAAVVFAGLVLAVTTSAEAQFGGVQRLLFRGMQYAGNHNFLSQPQNGPLYDYNRFSNRLEYNRDGDGYTYEFYQFFGDDSFGNPNTLDLGPLKIELGLDSTLLSSGQPVGIHNRIGYTTRILPEVFIESQTGQRGYNQFSGISNFAPAPLNYTVTLNTGIQDFAWTGNALIDSSARINALGFYDVQFRFVNVGDYTASGVFVQDEQVTDFDIGPIDVSGNIGFDLLAGLWQSNGSTTQALPGRIFSGAAQKDKRTEDLLARLQAGETLGTSDLQYLAQQMFKAAVEADPLGVLMNGMPSVVPGFEGLSLAMSASPSDSSPAATSVPEPGTLAFLALALGLTAGAHPFTKRRRKP